MQVTISEQENADGWAELISRATNVLRVAQAIRVISFPVEVNRTHVHGILFIIDISRHAVDVNSHERLFDRVKESSLLLECLLGLVENLKNFVVIVFSLKTSIGSNLDEGF